MFPTATVADCQRAARIALERLGIPEDVCQAVALPCSLRGQGFGHNMKVPASNACTSSSSQHRRLLKLADRAP
jgi:hypothetical protein